MGEMLCQAVVDHSNRARALFTTFGTAERLAEFMHQNYRAEAKSLKVRGPKAHDHGWCDCYGKFRKYLLRRAEWLLTEKPHFNGRVPR